VITIAIDPGRCRKDGLCALACPTGIFVQREKATTPEPDGEERCICCGHCVAICPSGAIAHSAFLPGSVTPNDPEKMPSPEQVVELLRSRRSIRAFRDRPLEKEIIERIIDAARFAPSAHNSQSTEYLVVLDRALLSRLSAATIEYLKFGIGRINSRPFRILISLANRQLAEMAREAIPTFERPVRLYESGADPILQGAPALLVFHARRGIALAEVNAQLALQNASLMAHSLGVAHFCVGWLMAACRVPMSRAWRRRIPDLLGLPPENNLYGVLALGDPALEFKNWIEIRPARVRWV